MSDEKTTPTGAETMTVMNTATTRTDKKVKKMLVEVPDIRELSCKKITMDLGLQSRAEMSLEHIKMLDQRRQDGLPIEPIIVFQDGDKYWLADGFHRLRMAIKAGLPSIKAIVKQGNKRDAMIYSAGANQEFSLKRTPEDTKKAVFMLLSDSEWQQKSCEMIAAHVGVHVRTTLVYRKQFHESQGIPYPEYIQTKNGKLKRFPQPRFSAEPTMKHDGEAYTARVGGRYVYLSTDREKASQKLAEAIAKTVQKRQSLAIGAFRILLEKRSIRFTNSNFAPPYAIEGFYLGDLAVCITDFSKSTNIHVAISRATLLRQHLKDKGQANPRALVICYPEDGPEVVLDLARKTGVEFLTPHEFLVIAKDYSASTPNPKDSTPCPD